jgi:uncharacterized membrane protein
MAELSALPESRDAQPFAERLLTGTVLSLIGILVLWEVWLAPIRPGGSWLALKALPLCAALPGLFARRNYTRQWLSLLLPLYVAEGVVRAWSEAGRVRAFASAEIVLALLAFAMILGIARRRRTMQSGSAGE